MTNVMGKNQLQGYEVLHTQFSLTANEKTFTTGFSMLSLARAYFCELTQ
jgi:hypothetical protein